MARFFDGYRPVENIEPRTVDNEKPAFATNSGISNAERSWSLYRINPILFMLLMLSITLNVTTDIQLQRQQVLTVEAPRSRFGKI